MGTPNPEGEVDVDAITNLVKLCQEMTALQILAASADMGGRLETVEKFKLGAEAEKEKFLLEGGLVIKEPWEIATQEPYDNFGATEFTTSLPGVSVVRFYGIELFGTTLLPDNIEGYLLHMKKQRDLWAVGDDASDSVIVAVPAIDCYEEYVVYRVTNETCEKLTGGMPWTSSYEFTRGNTAYEDS